ncbi:MAG: hypothetical protein ACK5LS_08885 [Propioniciclava sp.]
MRVAIVALTGAIAVVAVILGLVSDHPTLRKVAWAVAGVAVVGGAIAWVLLESFGVPGRIT